MENDVKRLEIVADRFSKIGSTPKLEELKVYDVVKDFMDYFKIRVSKNITFELSGSSPACPASMCLVLDIILG